MPDLLQCACGPRQPTTETRTPTTPRTRRSPTLVQAPRHLRGLLVRPVVGAGSAPSAAALPPILPDAAQFDGILAERPIERSEERRVGKEGRGGWVADAE